MIHNEIDEKAKINEYLAGIEDLCECIGRSPIYHAIKLLSSARINGNRIFAFGNGGSASTASHFATDLAKNTAKHQPPFKVICLADSIPSITAYANDEGYENVFVGQLKNLVYSGDVIFAISSSGNSPNVVTAVEYAKRVGRCPIIGLTGLDGGKLKALSDVHIRVPSDVIEQVEDIHLMVCHMIVKSFKE